MSSSLPSALSTSVSSVFTGAVESLGTTLNAGLANRQSIAATALSRGAQAAQAKDFELAIREFKRAAAYSPGDPMPYSYMGQVYMMQGRREEAIDNFNKALKISPQNDPIRLQLGKAYLESGKNVEAEKEYLKLEKTNPTSAEPPTTLGFIYLNSGRLAEADTQFQRVLQSAQTSPTAYYNLGLVRNKQGRFEDAAKLFEQAIALDQNHANAHADLAYAYLGMDDPGRAKQQYNELVNLSTSAGNALAAQVYDAIETPKFFYNDVVKSDFNTLQGAQTPVANLDPSLATPGASKVFKMTFVFNQDMNIGSVMNLMNWSITKADGSSNGAGGTYNDGAYINQGKQAYIPIAPMSVTYDTKTKSATIYFRVTQNATGDAVTDPKHWVFSFKGTDAGGRPMDKRGDQYDGYSLRPF
jgi:tetratricopeptide (TPR) repeat protein